MTRGDMVALLSDQPDAEQLSFLMTYVYIYNWLQHNVQDGYKADLLAVFSKGPQAFLMKLLLDAESTEAFVSAYIQHWKNYAGEAQLQQRHCLQMLAKAGNDPQQLIKHIVQIWKGLGFFWSVLCDCLPRFS